MSGRLNLSIVSGMYDRVQALRDGRVRIEGCDHTYLTADYEQMFSRAFKTGEYDVSELSMGSYITAVARGDNRYVAVPVFLSRLFRHSAVYYNAKAGITQPSDLAGKKIGVPEYQMTAALWCRGFLDDEYGVSPDKLHWFQGGLQDSGRYEKVPLNLRPEIRIETIGPGKTLDAMLISGEIDALISARTPHSFASGDPRVKRLFPDYRQVEREYHIKTKVFPIMHVLGIRRDLVDAYAWLPNVVYDAFSAAKDVAVDWLSHVAALRVTLPWLAAELEDTRRIMGADFWPYGIDPNERTLSLMLEYSFRHGLTDRLLTTRDLFPPSTFVQHKI